MAQETKVQRFTGNRPEARKHGAQQATDVHTISPPVDIFETKDHFVIVADMPGVAREDLDIQVDRRTLVVEGTRKVGDQTVSYRRSFNLPDTVDGERIAAECKNGVLRLTIPLATHAKPRRIEVRGA